jgi:tripartite-type tricarboxylate transporter receptor subunit TctC
VKIKGLRFRRTPIVAVVAALLLLQACGTDDGDANGDAADGTADVDDAEEAADEDVEWPMRTLEYVVPYNPGGSTDPIGRKFAELLAEETGYDVTVHNRAGADETIGISSVIIDGQDLGSHIMGLTSATGIIVQPLVNPDIEYEDQNDWTNVVKMIEAPNAILVRDDAPWENIEEFIEDARSRPGEISVGSTGRVTNNSFAIAALNDQADIELNLVSFSGGAGEAVSAVLGGQVDAAIPTISAQLGFIEAGELRSLAHTGDSPYDPIPDSTPLGELGYDIPFSSDYFTIAPPDLPEAEREALVEAALAVVESDEFREWCEENGYIWDPTGPDEMSQWIEDTIEPSRQAIELIEQLDVEEVD